jgi:DNA-binding GntR family transcriptional regulator
MAVDVFDSEATPLSTISAPASIKEMAFVQLKDAIINHRLKTEVLYTEPEMARMLGISRTPVREALIELSSRGFLSFLPRKGFKLTVMDESLIEELYTFRRILETSVLKEVIGKLGEPEMETINQYYDEQYATVKEQDLEAFIRADRAFHTYLANLTGNRYITNSLEKVRDLCDWAAYLITQSSDRRWADTIREHEKIVEALNRKDTDDAASAMREHLETAKHLALNKVRQR